ncbi:MAG: hypothetical protein ABEJ89_09650 [Haloarculaceae archaeon]
MSTLARGTRLRLTELARQPTTLAMLVVLPPVVIEVYGAGLASFPSLPSLGMDPGTAGRLTGTLFAVAFLAGLVGLFQVISARSGDERLALCGYPRTTLLATRLATMLAVVVVGTAVSFAMFALEVDVAAPLSAVGALALAGLIYGLLGVIVGTVLPRGLEGSLVLVFMADMDNVLASGIFDLGTNLAAFSPLYHPHALFERAVLDGTVATDHVLPALAYAGVLLVVAVLAYGRAVGDGGGLA